jgi:hypothetical protein
MIITLKENLEELPQLYKGDIIITKTKGDTRGYFWSDIQCIVINRERKHGLQLTVNSDGGLQVLEDYPKIELKDMQISLFDYAKEKGIEL